jgi:hypothetical protein
VSAGGSRRGGDISVRVAQEIAAAIAGSGGPVGVTVDGRAATVNPLPSGTFPVFRFGWAPAGLATRRQLSACGLRPGGAPVVARIEWRAGRRWADLYAVATAKPKRPMTPAKTAALGKAMAARRTCPTCGRDVGYCIPLSLGECPDCHFPAIAAA